jgi:hypothetical protein
MRKWLYLEIDKEREDDLNESVVCIVVVNLFKY